MIEYDYEVESFEAFIRFYAKEIWAIHRGEVRAVDFTHSFRRCLGSHGVVSRTGYGYSWVVTPRALAVLEAC